MDLVRIDERMKFVTVKVYLRITTLQENAPLLLLFLCLTTVEKSRLFLKEKASVRQLRVVP